MKLQQEIIMDGKVYPKGTEVAWYQIYPFFLVHVLGFGVIGFCMAYCSNFAPVRMQLLVGGFAIFIYTAFYLAIFGCDEVKWMFINGGLGLLGIYSQIGWLLSLFGKKVGDYPYYVHAVPFLYVVLYTFLLRHALLDLTQSRENPARKKLVENGYIAASVVIYVVTYLLERRA